jgi:hypothetical protein
LRSIGCVGGVLHADAFREGKTGEGDITFPDINAAILEVVIDYLHYKVQNNTRI